MMMKKDLASAEGEKNASSKDTRILWPQCEIMFSRRFEI
jgi:hypothetical protein